MTKERNIIHDLDDSLKRLLRKVKEEKEFYVPLHNLHNQDAEDENLRFLSKLGLIHWCPYPDEFYILTPKGMEVLNDIQG